MLHRIGSALWKNIVFLALALAVVLMAMLMDLHALIGENPFASEIELNSPVTAVAASDVRYYVTESNGSILIVDRNNKLLRQVDGYNETNSFSILSELAAGEKGTFYVLDKIIGEDQVSAEKERILRFTGYGNHCEVLYEEDTASDGEQTVFLQGLIADGDSVKFARISKSGIEVLKLTDSGTETLRQITYPQANQNFYDCALSSGGQVAAVTMLGHVILWTADSNTPETIAADETEEGWSLISEAAFLGETLYLTDVGQRCIDRWNGQGLETIVGSGTFGAEAESLAASPLYTGLTASSGELNFLSSEFCLDEDGEQVYTYYLMGTDESGEVMLDADTVQPSGVWRFQVFALYLALVLALVLGVFAAVLLIRALRGVGSFATHIQIILLAAVSGVSLLLGYYIFNVATSRYVESSTEDLGNIAILISRDLSTEDLKQLSSPAAYGSEAYERVGKVIDEDLALGRQISSSIYAVLYGTKDDVLYETYRNIGANPVMYPLAGTFSDSLEENSALTGDMIVENGMALSEGTFSFVEIPIYDEQGRLAALLEVGESYAAITAENNQMLREILIQVFMVLIIVMLLMTEFLAILSAARKRRQVIGTGKPLPPEVIRPVSFFVFFTANITTAFLPIYGMSLWAENFPLRQEIAAALPLSAELVCGAVFSLLCGRWLKKRSPRFFCAVGAVCYICGNLGAILAVNLWMLILANSFCGVGSGLLLVSINTWIARQKDERSQNQGYIHYNAAYLSGMNCGSVVGALVWENFGIAAAYLAAGISAGILLLAVFLFLDRGQKAEEEVSTEHFSLKQFFTPGMIRYFLCLAIPYLICASFLSYFFPIIGEENNLSATEISMAFLISGVISIYVGAEIGDLVVEKLGVRKSILLASFMYAIALFYLVYRPSIASCYAVIVIFALADSFGLSAQSVYFADRQEVKLCGESASLAVNSTIESLTSACGSLIFGAVLMMGYRTGILIIAGIFTALLFAFIFIEKMFSAKQASEVS